MSEYYTVSQYVKVFGKDPGNIRRMVNYSAIELPEHLICEAFAS